MSDIIQGSPEWHAARCGKVTASRVADVIARPRRDGRQPRQLHGRSDRGELTGEPAAQFTNAAMQWGTTRSRTRGRPTSSRPIRSCRHRIRRPSKIYDSGASPDGLIGADGMVEFKCPNTATHIERC